QSGARGLRAVAPNVTTYTRSTVVGPTPSLASSRFASSNPLDGLSFMAAAIRRGRHCTAIAGLERAERRLRCGRRSFGRAERNPVSGVIVLVITRPVRGGGISVAPAYPAVSGFKRDVRPR